jgi:NAD(P)-dependent dehydrogenase (short-subunit alcohol dehydrogenase family)
MALKGFRGKTAFITGAASGMGRGMARVFAQNGINIALADIDLPTLEEARNEIGRYGVEAIAYLLDASDRAQVYEIADAVERDFGKVHIVCNNAGVGSGTPALDETPDEIFDWMFAVNTMGPINGFKAFAPKLKKHGEGGHFVNTASIAGVRIAPGMNNGIYAGTKFAVVALSFAMQDAMAKYGIGVSVLCPAGVDTNIYRAGRVRPDRFGGPFEREISPAMARLLKEGLSPDQVGQYVFRAIQDDDFFIFTHPETRQWVEEWHARVMHGFDRADTLRHALGINAAPQPDPSKMRRG